jgi:transposase
MYIDESGFCLTRKAKTKEDGDDSPPLTMVPRAKRLNLILGLSADGVIAHRFIYTSSVRRNQAQDASQMVSDEDHREFFVDLLSKVPARSILILNNTRIQYAKMFDELVQEANNSGKDLDYLFMSPFSPFLNPLEFAFQNLKESLSRKSLTKENLRENIENELPTVSEHARDYIASCEKYYRACSLGVPITGTILNPDVLTEK